MTLRLTLALLLLPAAATASETPAKPHGQLVAEVMGFLLSDVGHDGILTMDGDPQGAPVPPYFYHYSIRHDGTLASSTSGYPGYASISYPGYTASIMVDCFLAWWAYEGDPEGLARACEAADWLLPRRTPPGDLYGNMPYSTQTDGVMGGGYDGDAIMSDKPGMFGVRLLRLFEATGDSAYHDAAVEIGDSYVAAQLPDGRWPFRVRPSDGVVRQDYTSHLWPAIDLLQRLEALHPGQGYGAAADAAWGWLEAVPMGAAGPDTMRWEGFYEDIGPESAGLRDHYSAEATLVALLERDQPGDLERALRIHRWSTDRYWAPGDHQTAYGQHAPALLEWDAWPNSTYAATGQWAWTTLRLEEATRGTADHDSTWYPLAVKALHTLTHGQRTLSPGNDGRMLTTVRELVQPNFGIDTWYEQNFNTVIYMLASFPWAPELAPDDRDHLLRFVGGELTAIDYDRGGPRLRASFAAAGEARFKLVEMPRTLRIGGQWYPVPGVDGSGHGWGWDATRQLLDVWHPGGEVLVERGVATATGPARAGVRLEGPFPNPANPRFAFALELERGSVVSLRLVDARGRKLRQLHAGWLPAGRREFRWDGQDDAGSAVASGVYWLQVEVDGWREQRPVVLVR